MLESYPVGDEFRHALAAILAESWVWRWHHRRVERDLRLEYLFGGSEVAYIDRRDGREVVGIDDEIPDAVKRLSPEDRKRVVFAMPPAWDAVELGPFADENTAQAPQTRSP